jgi:hypothetical protein
MRVIRMFGLSGALLLMACSGGSTNVSSDESAIQSAAAARITAEACAAGTPDPQACDPAQTKKTTICHIPPGNPENVHTLCVGTPAVEAHLAHGDTLGTCCATPAGGDPTTPPPPSDPPPPPPTSPPSSPTPPGSPSAPIT